jgi:TolB-like protein
MELVEGLSLDKLIPKKGLPVERFLMIATALAGALAAAHEKGIVHRDLKPANVMVTFKDSVKVLDFGLAKEICTDNPDLATLTSAESTRAGVNMGTPAYMSPEQIVGRELDHRTDFFSLGVMLYEMAVGQRPFEGKSSAELASAILRDTPRPLGDLRADLPGHLARIIQRCLEKNPADRFASAREICDILRGVTSEIFSVSPPAAAADPVAEDVDHGFRIAVLPFTSRGANDDLNAFAEGVTEGIVTGLSRFSYLRVIALSSTLRYAHEEVDIRAVGKELRARYVMEGNIRQSGSTLRIAAQLVDASSGAHIWAETYDRTLRSEDVFELQDDVVPRIVSTVADTHGVLPHTMSEALRSRTPEQLTPYEAVLRGFANFRLVSVEEHRAAMAALERAAQQAPGNADCLAMLSMLIREEYTHGFNVRPDPLGRAFATARRAVEAAPSNHLAYHALASAQFFRRERQAFRNSAERAVALNPMDGFTAAYMGFLIAYDGNWERGCALSAHARELNPNHPGWYLFPSIFDAYRKSDYQGALDLALKVNMPGFWRTNLALATAYGQLGEREAARNAVLDLLAIRPNFAAVAWEELAKWWDPKLVNHLIEGLRKAGLEIAPSSS